MFNEEQNIQLIIERIKQLRENLKLSYQELAVLTGMSKSTLQRYETGAIKNIPLSKVNVLAKALHTTPAYLMGWDKKESTNNSELDSQIEDLYNSLPEDKQKQAIEFLKFLQGK